MTVAARREAEQRQRAEESAEFGERAALQKHQGSGRRLEGLRNGHVSSCSGSAPYVAAASAWGISQLTPGLDSYLNAFSSREPVSTSLENALISRRKTHSIVPQRNMALNQARPSIPAFKRQ